MTHITFTVSPEMKKEMEKFSEIDWFKVTQDAIKEKLTTLKADPIPFVESDKSHIPWYNWTDF